MTISPEEFAEWQQHPVTEWVMKAMLGHAEAQKSIWAELAWEKGHVDTQTLTEARVRSHCYLAIPESSYEDWKAINDTEA